MGMRAREVMRKNHFSLDPEMTIPQAVRTFQEASREFNYPVFGLVVTDASGALIGMLSMYDILLLIRPRHIQIWVAMEDIETSGLVEEACRRSASVLVGDIMTCELVTVGPEAHIFQILDIMLNQHIRRIPVVDGQKLLGMVYLSEVFNAVAAQLAAEDGGDTE